MIVPCSVALSPMYIIHYHFEWQTLCSACGLVVLSSLHCALFVQIQCLKPLKSSHKAKRYTALASLSWCRGYVLQYCMLLLIYMHT